MINELPMLATPSTGSSGRRPIRIEELVDRGWILDTKLDGVRAFARYGRLLNREGVDITSRFPEVTVPHDHWLDGEIVALDGSFETVQRRDKQVTPAKIKRLAQDMPCIFVAFDILDDHEERPAYDARRVALEHLLKVEGEHRAVGWGITPIGRDMAFFERVREQKMEGVIAKRPASRYTFGKRSLDWVKFKNLHRITMVAVGYERGNGARAHFGAMNLALVGPDGPTRGPGDGWRVGSGFTDKDTWELKRALDDGQLFAVEIEVLNRTSDGALRFPVFRGIRTDVPVHQCLVDQVDELPTC